MTAREYARQRSYDLGFHPDALFAMTGRRRPRDKSEARRTIAVELRQAPWSMSKPGIASILGCRNHTSVIWMLRGGRAKR